MLINFFKKFESNFDDNYVILMTLSTYDLCNLDNPKYIKMIELQDFNDPKYIKMIALCHVNEPKCLKRMNYVMFIALSI